MSRNVRPTCAGAAAAAAIFGLATAAAAGDPAAYRNSEDFSSEALFVTGLVTPGARAAAMAGTGAAIADDAFALVQNPAGLAQLVKIEVAGALRTERYGATFDLFTSSATRTEPESGLDAIAVAYPVPTYRGSLVFGAGVFRSRTNDYASLRRDERTWFDDRTQSTVRFDDEFLRRQSGSVWQWSAGVGWDAVRNVSCGVAASYWYAALTDDQFRHLDEQFPGADAPSEDHLQSAATLNGASFDAGLLAYAGGAARFGLVVRSPVWSRLDGTGTVTHTDLASGGSRSGALAIAQHPRLPWSAAAGASCALGGWLVAAEARWVAWDELELDAPGTPGGAPGAAPDYTARLDGRAAVEWTLPRLPVRVRAGVAYEPLAYDLLLGNAAARVQDRRTLGGGAGVLLSDALQLDAAATVTTSVRADLQEPAVRESRRDRRVVLSLSYRY